LVESASAMLLLLELRSGLIVKTDGGSSLTLSLIRAIEASGKAP